MRKKILNISGLLVLMLILGWTAYQAYMHPKYLNNKKTVKELFDNLKKG